MRVDFRPPENNPHRLDLEFRRILSTIKQLIPHVDSNTRLSLYRSWLEKLSSTASDKCERNRYLEELARQIGQNRVMPPFDRRPPIGPLQTFPEVDRHDDTANGTYHSLWFTSKYLIFINAAINPLIYGVTNEKFLRAFKSTGLSKWLFPSTKKEVIISKPIGQQKIGQDTSSKNTIFLIFKRKHKVADGPVPVTKKTNVNTNL